MSRQTLQIIVAIVFVIALTFYFSFRRPVRVDAPEPETVTEFIDESVPAMDDKVETPHETKNQDVTQEVPDFLDSLDEGTLGEEFNDVQSGIDLLNNPLQ